jgi:hypothetical protein
MIPDFDMILFARTPITLNDVPNLDEAIPFG